MKEAFNEFEHLKRGMREAAQHARMFTDVGSRARHAWFFLLGWTGTLNDPAYDFDLNVTYHDGGGIFS